MNKNLYQLAKEIKKIGKDLGFSQVSITDPKLHQENIHFKAWMKESLYGNMKYFEKHSEVYQSPKKLLPDTTRIICCRIDYPKAKTENNPIASFAQVQDYSSHIRMLLKKYVDAISNELNIKQNVRIFAGNAPLLEKALAAKAGLGWYGKNSLLINKDVGSYFFLGEILTDLSLPIDLPANNLCGDCFKCKDICPTKAIIAPHKIDARRCIAYLTIEYRDTIPIELRPLIGTRIYGCDACQTICPWNKKIKNTTSSQFKQFPHFTENNLIKWFLWDEKEFKEKIKETTMSRISHKMWLRNIAVALGNSPKKPEILEALKSRSNHPSPLVREHVEWAINRLCGD